MFRAARKEFAVVSQGEAVQGGGRLRGRLFKIGGRHRFAPAAAPLRRSRREFPRRRAGRRRSLALARPRATPGPGKCFLPKQKYTAFCQGNFLPIQEVDPMSIQLEDSMSIEGKVKEAAGYVKEELHENGDSPEARRKAQEGRDLRNEGRIEDGKAPKLGTPGTED
ncbi:hypothetical protein ACWKWJ_11375 [Sphingopyxis terrae subsp. ummariensis]